jgi:hypothetical protein
MTIIWQTIQRALMGSKRVLKNLCKQSKFLEQVTQEASGSALRSRMTASLENVRHMWYLRVSIVAAMLCAYELLGCRQVGMIPAADIRDSIDHAKRITAVVAPGSSLVGDFPIASAFVEVTNKHTQRNILLPGFVCGLPLMTTRQIR